MKYARTSDSEGEELLTADWYDYLFASTFSLFFVYSLYKLVLFLYNKQHGLAIIMLNNLLTIGCKSQSIF